MANVTLSECKQIFVYFHIFVNYFRFQNFCIVSVCLPSLIEENDLIGMSIAGPNGRATNDIIFAVLYFCIVDADHRMRYRIEQMTR